MQTRINPFHRVFKGILLAALVVSYIPTIPAEAQTSEGNRKWSPYMETNFPFFSSVLDARRSGSKPIAENLTPRGLILNLGHGCWACFDTDLLRVSAIWNGAGVTPVSMAQGSYHTAGLKAPEGEGTLPEIDGEVWLGNGIYPGWQSGESVSWTDPRPPGPDPKEVGRGPLPSSMGRFLSLQLTANGVLLHYEINGVEITEGMEARIEGGGAQVQRSFALGPHKQPLWLVLGRTMAEGKRLEATVMTQEGSRAGLTDGPDGTRVIQLGSTELAGHFSVGFAGTGTAATWPSRILEERQPPARRWTGSVQTEVGLSAEKGAYVVDSIGLPEMNPWRRNVRVGDLAFFQNGRAAAVTFDGDVWMIDGLGRGDAGVKWSRFASGLHEPLGICTRGEELFVFDRNGVWRLRDRDGNGEADEHELFSNNFGQTAETREFAAGVRAAPDGSLVIAKGGQVGTRVGKDNGTILRLSADGRSTTVLGWGLRQPFVAVNPRTGLITATDQQGHYIPSTPIHVIGDHNYYGFVPLVLPKEKYPAKITEPLTWIPHSINASAAAQVWLTGARMGPLSEGLIHLGYYRPEIFLVLLSERTQRLQASVLSVSRALDFAPLNGAVNPADGQLYVTGFQIWGTTASRVSGLARLRYTGAASTLPVAVTAMKQGVLLRFAQELGEAAADPENFSAERWNYVRTANYGSPHFKLDGSKGQDAMGVSSVYLSKDRKSVFVGMADMKPVMQMRLGWSLAGVTGARMEQNAYFTPGELEAFDPVREGFGSLEVNLQSRAARSSAPTPVTAAEGQRLSELMGCVACHSIDGSTLGKIGPSWKGIFGSERKFAGGGAGKATVEYLRESIKTPQAKIVAGYDKSDAGMPSYEGVLSDGQVEALIEYLKTVR